MRSITIVFGFLISLQSYAGVGGFYSPGDVDIEFIYSCSKYTNTACNMELVLNGEALGSSESTLVPELDQHWVKVLVPIKSLNLQDLEKIVVYISDKDNRTETNISTIGIRH